MFRTRWYIGLLVYNFGTVTPVDCQATVFAPFVFRFLLNRYVASEGLGEVGIHIYENVVSGLPNQNTT